MARLTYDDFKTRLSIQDILVEAGYTLNRRDGLRYPSYVMLDDEGRRIRGDKFIVTGNGLCCFQPPEQRNYNVISFIKEHPEKFADFTPGMDKDRLVNLVCNRLLNNPIEDRESRIVLQTHAIPSFRIEEYKLHRFEGALKESHKPFFPYFKPRGINLSTQYAFHSSFVIAERTTPGGHTSKLLSFPMTIPHGTSGHDQATERIVGFEQRGKRRTDGSSYKGMARGSNASEGLWLASPSATSLEEAKHIYIFESAYDAMAFYQLRMDKEYQLPIEKKEELKNGIFASTGGNPSARQLEGLIRNTKEAKFHLCFDMDEAGMKYTEQFKALAKRELVSDTRVIREKPSHGYKDFNDELIDKIQQKENPLSKENVPAEYKEYIDSFRIGHDDIPKWKDVLSPNFKQADLLPEPVRTLYAKYESLYEDAYEKKSSRLVAPCDKEDAIKQALKAQKEFRETLCKSLHIQEDIKASDSIIDEEDDDKEILHDVDYTTDIDEDGNIEVEEETSDQEERKHYHR